MTIEEVSHLTQAHYRLLLEADPSRRLVDDYIQRGTVFAAVIPELVGIMVLLPTRPDTLELVNIAVDENHQGKGYAQELIAYALSYAKTQGYKTVDVGTGSTGLGQLYLYQKCGFRMVGIDKDFFVRHYEEPVIDEGQVLRDMVRLSQDV